MISRKIHTVNNFVEFEYLNTDRLKLVRVDQAVMDYVFNSFSAQEQSDFFGCDSAQELVEQERRYRGGLSTFNRKFLYFFLLDKNTNKNMGWCGYHTWYTDHHRAEIGYTLKPAYHKKRLMTEALEAILEYGFQKMGLRRVEAFLAANNIPSQKLMNNFGFIKEGVARLHYNVQGKNEDSDFYSLLREEYFT